MARSSRRAMPSLELNVFRQGKLHQQLKLIAKASGNMKWKYLVLPIIGIVLVILFWGTVAFVGWHFISKLW